MGFMSGVTEHVVVFDGTRKDVFESIDNLVVEKGFTLFTRDLVIREPETVTHRNDIQKGDFILFRFPEHDETFCIGFDVGKREALERIVAAVGILFELPKESLVELGKYNLRETESREIYDDVIKEFNEHYTNVMNNFKDVLLVDATQTEFAGFIKRTQQKASVPHLLVYNVHDKTTDPVTLSAVDDIRPGMILIGESQREDGTPRLSMVGYEVDDDALIDFLGRVMGSGPLVNFKENPPTVSRILYKDSLLETDLG